jgi:hypothetical protein
MASQQSTSLKPLERLSLKRRNTITLVLCVLAVGCLLLAVGQLGHRPAPSRSDIYTNAELSEGVWQCSSVLRLVLEGSQAMTSKETFEPDVAWNDSCMAQTHPQATIGLSSLAAGFVFGSIAAVVARTSRKRTVREGTEAEMVSR